MAEPCVAREEQRMVTLSDQYGEARFLNGNLWALDLGMGDYRRTTLQLPSNINDTVDRLTGYIEFLRFVRAEVRRLRDGAQEADDATG